jgi:hypothetical protein
MMNDEISRHLCNLPLIESGLSEQEEPELPTQPSGTEDWYKQRPATSGIRNIGLSDHQNQSSFLDSNLTNKEGTSEMEAQRRSLDAEDLPVSFFEMEDWQEYHNDFEDHDIQKFFDVNFPRSRLGTPDAMEILQRI